MRKMISLVLVAMGMVAASAEAQVPPNLRPDALERVIPEAERRFQPLPYDQAAWYTAGRGGAGWFISGVDPNASTRLTSATLFTYDESGNAAWTIGTAPRVAWPMTAAAIWSDAPWGVWRAEMVEGTNGACPTCAYAPSTFTASRFGAVEMTWTGPASIAVKLGGTDVGVVRPADLIVGASFADRIQGQHLAVLRVRSNVANAQGPAAVLTAHCRMQFTPVAPVVPSFVVDAGFRASAAPSQTGTWYRWDSVCASPGEPLPASVPASSDPIQGYVILGGPDAAYAHYVAIDTSAISRDGNGNAQPYRLSRNTTVGRVFVDGPESLTFHTAQLQDTQSVVQEMRLARTAAGAGF